VAYVRVDVQNKLTPRGTLVSGLADLVACRSVVVTRRDRSCQGLRIRRSAATSSAAPGTDLMTGTAGLKARLIESAWDLRPSASAEPRPKVHVLRASRLRE